MSGLVRTTKVIGGLAVLLVRSVLVWAFVLRSVLAWLLGAAAWPLLRPFGVHVPLSPLYYSRWATYLLDALLSRSLPVKGSLPWPWQVDVRNSKMASWSDGLVLPD